MRNPMLSVAGGDFTYFSLKLILFNQSTILQKRIHRTETWRSAASLLHEQVKLADRVDQRWHLYNARLVDPVESFHGVLRLTSRLLAVKTVDRATVLRQTSDATDHQDLG